jgi:hypothetical protein
MRGRRKWLVICAAIGIGGAAGLQARAEHLEKVGPEPNEMALRDAGLALRRKFPAPQAITVRDVRVHVLAAQTVDPRLLVCGELRTAGKQAGSASAAPPSWALFSVAIPSDRIEIANPNQSGRAHAIRLACGEPRANGSDAGTRKLQALLGQSAPPHR